MTTPNSDRWRIVSPYLDAALDLGVEDRAAWLDSLRAQDPALAADVEALLEEHDVLSREGFLAGESARRPARSSLAGLNVGSYTLRSPLGQGGMGSVWLADRSDGRFEGRAAVKLLNASLIGRGGEARFKQEGSVLARLQHPHIAQLIDAGVSPLGQPYLVLEHVDGERIDRYCDSACLGIDARIRLFLDVLAAVAFAHANLVVHRDLKPPNVFVGKDGRVKLLDFGIAKLIEPEAGSPTLTREGELALTPEYAAPEQLTGGPITTATDVYALGILLYVLLTGRHPTGEGTTAPSDWIKAVVEVEPPRPSDGVVTADAALRETLAENAARRATNTEKLRRRLRGDLDNILARALKKRPGERYPSVELMAEDLRRHLSNETVSARADSLGYRAAKFVRRNRGGVSAAGLVLAVLLAGTAGVAWQAREARIQRDAARTQLARATATSEFTTFLLSVGAPAGKRFNVGELLEQGEIMIDKQFAGDDALRAEMLAGIGEQYLESEHLDKATRVLERAVAIASRSGDPAVVARASCTLAFLKILNGDRPGAEAMMSRALAGLPEGLQYAEQRAECLINYSNFGYVTGEAAPMISRATEGLELLEKSRAATPLRSIGAQAAIAYGYYMARQNRKADEIYAKLMASFEAAGLDRTVPAVVTLNNWGLVHFQGDIAKAEPLARRVVELRRAIEGAGSVAPIETFNYAGVLLVLGRYDEAEPLFEESIRTADARGERRILSDSMIQLAGVHIERGDLARASAQLVKLTSLPVAPLYSSYGPALLAYWTGRLAEARGDHASAREQFAKAVTAFDANPQKLAWNVQALIGLARADRALGDKVGAAAAAEKALALSESFVEPGAPSYLVGLSLAARGDLERANGAGEPAKATFTAALEHLERTLGPDHPATKSVRERTSS